LGNSVTEDGIFKKSFWRKAFHRGSRGIHLTRWICDEIECGIGRKTRPRSIRKPSYTAQPKEKKMKRVSIFILAAAAMSLVVPGASAQAYFHDDHVQAGIYGEYFRWDQTSTNLTGLGGRLSFNVSPRVQLEAEMGYDFEQAFTEGFKNTSTGTVTLVRTNSRKIDGLFGPKFLTNRGPVRLFLTVKGGGISFHFDPRPATFQTFASTVDNLRAGDVNGVLYPGGGIEAFLGPFGLRLDVGDEIYFASGAHHNLRLTFGPTIRF
jgi:hypothetical protein